MCNNPVCLTKFSHSTKIPLYLRRRVNQGLVPVL